MVEETKTLRSRWDQEGRLRGAAQRRRPEGRGGRGRQEGGREPRLPDAEHLQLPVRGSGPAARRGRGGQRPARRPQAAEERARRQAEEEERRQQQSNSGGNSGGGSGSGGNSGGSSSGGSGSSGGSSNNSSPRPLAARPSISAYGEAGQALFLGRRGAGFYDCSGLVSYCLLGRHSRLGTAASFMGYTRVSNPKPGDICCNDHHCGIYIGDGQMIHAPRTGDVVKIPPCIPA